MTFEKFLQQLGYTQAGDRWKTADGESIAPQGLEQLQESFNSFNQTDAQGRPVYGSEAYLPGTMSDAYGQGLFRLGQADAGPQLGPILQNMGASVQYDPRYGYVVPQAAQDEWSKQYGQPKGFDAFMENLASNAPIALGGAVLGAGLGYGPFAGGSLEGGAAAGGGGVGIGGGAGGAADAAGGAGMFDDYSWLDDIIGVPGGGEGPGIGSADYFGAGDIDPSFWSGGGISGDPSNGWGTDETALANEVVKGNPGALDQLKRILGNPSDALLRSIIGSGVQGITSLLASRAQTNSANQANNTLLAMYNQNRADLAPYREAGTGALNQLVDLTTPGKQFTTMQADPGYQFRYDQGEKALDNRLRAGGKFYSGSALKAGQDYAQGFASNEFGNVYNRLAGLAGTGQTATNTTAGLGSNTATGVAQNQTGAGNARASGYVGLGNAVQGGIANYQQNELLNALLQGYGRGY